MTSEPQVSDLASQSNNTCKAEMVTEQFFRIMSVLGTVADAEQELMPSPCCGTDWKEKRVDRILAPDPASHNL